MPRTQTLEVIASRRELAAQRSRRALAALLAAACALVHGLTHAALAAPVAHPGPAPAPQRAADLPSGLIVMGTLPSAPPLGRVLRSAKVGDRVTFAARVAGRANPFVSGRAIMVVSDPALLPCNEREDDLCPTPADLCCESRETLLANTATVQVLDGRGRPLAVALSGHSGLASLDHVVVEGELVERGENGGFVVTASRIVRHDPATGAPTPPADAAAPVTAPAATRTMPTMADQIPADLPGLHNLLAFHENFISGSGPEGEEAFDSLAALGFKTIISVDGGTPRVELAQARGIRYIHLPIGYNGFDEKRKRELTRAVRDALADGPVYIHCHHGKHRSAGAAATVAVSLGWSNTEAMIERMKMAGTSPSYKGLYACAREATPLPKEAIDAVPADFPSISKPGTFVQGMVDIDHAFDHLRLIEKAGWRTPADHPDLVPAAEAGRLSDLFLHLKGGAYTQRKPDDFKAWMESSHQQAQLIENELASGNPDLAKVTAAFKSLGASCKECHVAYRD